MQPEKFGTVAIFLHWLIAAGVVAAVIAGLVSDYTNDAALTRSSLAFHQSVGVAIFVFALGRLAWRITHAVPPFPPETPRSQKIAATVTHWALYGMLFVLPVTGYIALASRGRAITVFGLFDLPNIVPLSLKTAALTQNIHDNGQYLLYALFALHAGAALYHRLVLNDGILERMWFTRRRQNPVT